MKQGSKRKFRRVLAMALVFTMLMGMPGLAALAAETDTTEQGSSTPELKLWYDEPASQTGTPGDAGNYNPGTEGNIWQQDTLPIGNGTIGAGVYGEIGTERLLLNEQTLWLGGPSESRPDYMGGNVITGKGENGATLQHIVDTYLQTGNIVDTGKLTGAAEWGQGYGYYAPWGELRIAYSGVSSANAGTYQRWLSIDNALAGVKFTSGGTTYNREYLVSNPDNVLAAKLTSTGGAMNLTITLPGRTESTGGTDAATVVGNDTLRLSGALSDNQLKFASFLKVVPTDGTVTGSGSSLTVTGATEVTLFFSAATDYKNEYPVYRTGETDAALAARVLEKVTDAATKGYAAVKQDHLDDYYSLYNRMSLNLGQGSTTKTTDALLSAYNNGTASESERRLLEVTLFQYGRYLTIASSRENSQLPSNLQGIWNYHTTNTPWHSDFHTNVNLQMNYWPVYSTNLTECADPLIRYIDSLREPGRVTAKVYAGIESTPENPENGFMAHTQNTPYGWTCPGWSFSWGWAPAAIAWMLQNCWEYYEYTGDVEFMKNNIYPMMKEYARLYDQLLVDIDPSDEVVYATVPAYSPEHGPATAGNTFEHSLVWQLYTDCITAAELLNDTEYVTKWTYMRDHLEGPIEIGDEGQIKEWYHETGISKDQNGATIGQGNGHRHLSHMLGLFPGDLVQTKEEWVEAARVSMNARTDESTGWGMGQRINTWARLGDGNKAYKLIGDLFKGGMYVNLWDAHAPFQIDGNFGYTAGVVEMLMQSNMGFIDLMPALPDAWLSGSYSGILTRGNFELSAAWANKSLTRVDILSKNGGECAVRYPNISRAVVTDSKGNLIEFEVLADDKISFPSAKGATYTITEIPAQNITVAEDAEALRTEADSVTVRWTGEEGVTYQVYRQIENGDILPLNGATTNPYVDNTADEDLGKIQYYIQAEGCELSGAIKVVDLRNMERVDDQYSLDGSDANGTPIVFTGSWGIYNQNDSDYKTTCVFVNEADVNGQTATLTFRGTGIQARGHGYNSEFTMAIDGGPAQSFTSGNSSARDQVLGEITNLEYGIHKVVLTLTGKKIDFDGFNVLGNIPPVVEDPDTLEISTVGGVEKLWNAGDTVQFTANLDGVTWTTRSSVTHATTCDYPDHKYSWNADTQTLTAGLTDEVVEVTATKGSQTVRKEITITPKTTVTIIEDAINGTKNTAITWGDGWSAYTGEAGKHHGGSKTENGTSYSYSFTGTGTAIFVQKNGHSSWSNNSYTVVLDSGKASEQTKTPSGYDSTLSTAGVNQQKLVEFLDLENTTHTINVTASGTGRNLDFIEVYAPNPNAPQANLEDLKAAVAEAADYSESSYTAESWAPLADALATAGDYLNNTVNATQTQADDAAAAIRAAIEGLAAKPLSAPENVKAILVEGTAVTLKWDSVIGATSYKVTVGGETYTAQGTTYRVTGLESGVGYSFTVKAANDGGESEDASEAVTVTTLDTVAPKQPTNLAWNESTNTLTWTAATDNVDVTGYKVLVNGVQQGETQAATSKALTLSGTQNALTVIAVDAAGNESIPAKLVVAPTYLVAATNATIQGGKTRFKVGEAVTVTATVPEKGSILTGWTVTGVTLSADDKTAETVTFSMPAGNVSLIANMEEKNWEVTANLTNLLSNLPSNKTVAHGDELTVKLTAYDPYKLPTSVQVVMGGQQLQSPWVTYDVTTGTITVREVTGDVVITAENAPQTPTGATFTAADPFQLPTNEGNSTKLEAEYMELAKGSGSSLAAVYGPNFGNKQLTGFVSGDEIKLYYNAEHPGTYTLTLRYSSAQTADTAHKFNWSGENVEDQTNSVGSTLEGGTAVYSTTELEFTVTEAGSGMVTFTTAAPGGPDIDSMTFTLDRIDSTLVEEITLDQDEVTLYLSGDDGEDAVTLQATVKPDDASNQDVRWSSSDVTVAYVTQEGLVGARSNGTATITARAMDGSEVTATAEVTVKTRVSGSVSISGQAKYGQNLVASTNQVSNQNAQETLTYQWNRNGEAIGGATDRHYTVTEDDIGCALTVTAFAHDPYVGAEGGTTSAPVTATKADGPDVTDTLDAVDFTDTENGKITGLDATTAYEYKLVSGGEEDWEEIPAGSTEFTVPAPGSYHVRVAASKDDTTAAGAPSSTLTILEANATGNAVNIGAFTGGVVRADVNKANEGDTVTLTVLPKTGYQLKEGSLKVNDEVVAVTDNSGTFAMPDGEATVTAEFKLKTYEIEHSLSDIRCDLVEHEVEHGATPLITLEPETGFDLPQVITVTVTETGAPFTDYTYDDGQIIFDSGITAGLTITGAAIKKSLPVIYALYGLTSLDGARSVEYGAGLSFTITPKTSYTLPDEISITMDGKEFTDFDYDVADGVATVTIAAEKITGELAITAEGESDLPSLALVEIQGTAKVGQTLRAVATPSNVFPDYRWLRVDSDGNEFPIYGATNRTYVVTTDDEGYTIKVAATGEGVKYGNTIYSEPTGVVENANVVATTGVALNKTSATITVFGNALQLTATVQPTNASNKAVTWKSSNENVAFVTSNGAVSGRGLGTATITVTTVNGEKTATCTVTVVAVSLPANVSVNVGSTTTINPTVPEDLSNKDLTWSSNNKEVATVDENGVVTGVKAGTATITVETGDGYTADCTVTVKVPSSSSSSTSTKTETREDGTAVTTVKQPDGTVTETVKQPDGTQSETVTTPEGNTTITVTDPDGEELAKVELPAEIPAPETVFEDIDQTPWAVEAINNMAGLELVKGIGGNKYDPTTPMTRGALATVLHRLSNGKTDYKVAFKDVQSNKYYTEGVAWAAKANVVKGVSQDIFAPDQIITREQLAVMLARYAKLIGMDTKADTAALDEFADGGSTGSWAVDGVAWCVENGILKGKGANTLDPTANVSRAEVAVMLDRFINLIK